MDNSMLDLMYFFSSGPSESSLYISLTFLSPLRSPFMLQQTHLHLAYSFSNTAELLRRIQAIHGQEN